MSQEYSRTFMILFIGRPVLNDQWQRRDFPTRDITWQEDLRNVHYQVHTYQVPPIFDAPTAQQLLTSIDYTVVNTLDLYVSFLELDHQQCVTILNGLTTLMDNLPDRVNITLRLEYERGNQEHRDAVQQAEAIVPRRRGCVFSKFRNVHIEALSKMAVNGDNGHGTLDHLVVLDDDD